MSLSPLWPAALPPSLILAVHDEHFPRCDLEEAGERRHRLARQVHERHGLEQPQRLMAGAVQPRDQPVMGALGLQ
jgi:hypothetical protein